MTQIYKIYKQDKVNAVLKRFKSNYKNNQKGKNTNKIINELNALTSPFNAKDVDTIIGNNSWTRHECDICYNDVEELIVLIPKYYDEYENSDIRICNDCLSKACTI